MTQPKSNNKLISRLLILVIAMFGFGFALVPLYNVFCSVTGLNGKTGGKVTFADAPTADMTRTIKMEFITSLNESMPWEFKPLTRSVEIHPGKTTKVEFYVKNLTDKDIVGQAIPSVSTGLAASYLHKTECFCFSQQTLKAGEAKTMPVIFVIGNDIPDDIHELTLSYTFFVISESKPQLAHHESNLKHNQEISL